MYAGVINLTTIAAACCHSATVHRCNNASRTMPNILYHTINVCTVSESSLVIPHPSVANIRSLSTTTVVAWSFWMIMVLPVLNLSHIICYFKVPSHGPQCRFNDITTPSFSPATSHHDAYVLLEACLRLLCHQDLYQPHPGLAHMPSESKDDDVLLWLLSM